jgi:long-chain fatty acid transport protein
MRYQIYAILFSSIATSTIATAAEGLRALPDSAEAMGIIGGRFAQLDDPSVVRTNPATLTDLLDPAMQVNLQVWHGETDFTRFDGAKDSMIVPWKQLGGFNLVHPISDGVTAGLGFSTPFGLSINWPRQGLFRYVAPFDAAVQTAALNPAVGLRISDKVSLGLGVDVLYSRLKLEQAFPWAAVTGRPSADGIATFESDGWGLGGYLGVNIDVTEKHRLALTGRLPVSVDYEGDFEVSSLPAPLRGTFLPSSPFDSEIEYPGSIGVGWGWDVTEKLSIGVDFEWIQNSTHDDLPLLIGANQPLLGGAQGIDLRWRDSISTGFGVSYEVDEHLTLRAGYLYSESPLRDETYIPSVPANDRHILSVGAGYAWSNHSVDFAYSFMPMESRNVSGALQPAFNGDYDYRWNVLAISWTTRF